MPIHQHVALGWPPGAPGHCRREQGHLSEDGASIIFLQGPLAPGPEMHTELADFWLIPALDWVPSNPSFLP